MSDTPIDTPVVAPKMWMHSYRALHSHFSERISYSDALADHLRTVIGFRFADFIKALNTGALDTEITSHNGIDWYLIHYRGVGDSLVVAACVPFLGMTGDKAVQIEAERASTYFENLPTEGDA